MFKVIGADGQQYGPVSVEQVRTWIAEGRANAQTLAQRPGETEWKPLGLLPEFASQFRPSAPPPPIQPVSFTSVATPPPRANSYALAGLILGLVSVSFGLCCYGLPFNILGLIFSLVGLSQIDQNPHAYTGRGMAIAGLVLSLLSLAFFAVILLGRMALGFHHFRRGFYFRLP